MKVVEIAMFAADLEETRRFYETLLGVKPKYASPDIAVFHVGELTLLIHRKIRGAPSDPPAEDHIALGVGDVDGACGRLEQRGLAAAYAPQDYDWGRSAYFEDPDGRLVELHQTNGGG